MSSNRFRRAENKIEEEPKPKKDYAPRVEQPSPLLTEPDDMELHIDERNLNRELMDQPLRFKKWVKLLAGLSRKAKAIKSALERKEAELRIKFSADGTGKRVAEVEACVRLDIDYQKLENDLHEAEELVDSYTGIVKAFHQRHEMLKDLCANKRKELVD